MTADSDVLNTSQAAAYLGSHAETVRRLARRGEIPCFKVGADWRFSREALQRWFDPQRGTAGPGRILVVDDDPEVVRAISRIVEVLGCKARAATNGVEALDLVKRDDPDLIFLDLAMPEMNGPEFLEALRPDHPELPVVIVTGYPDGDLMLRAAQYPPVMLIPKPASLSQVEGTLRAVLGERLPRP